ncbi:MAG: cbb3-type cytochrome oxidase assembly protein CcoS [Proteobacteria bacterium]|nr:cbb3-type cytochrome oxidase assembly protein CcoS [Pseudomonadota bacterium]
MDVIYWLIPVVILLGLVMLGILVWAIKSGQYEDLEGEGSRILMDEDEKESSPGDSKNRQ